VGKPNSSVQKGLEVVYIIVVSGATAFLEELGYVNMRTIFLVAPDEPILQLR
jgi:hypothetical protein